MDIIDNLTILNFRLKSSTKVLVCSSRDTDYSKFDDISLHVIQQMLFNFKMNQGGKGQQKGSRDLMQMGEWRLPEVYSHHNVSTCQWLTCGHPASFQVASASELEC